MKKCIAEELRYYTIYSAGLWCGELNTRRIPSDAKCFYKFVPMYYNDVLSHDGLLYVTDINLIELYIGCSDGDFVYLYKISCAPQITDIRKIMEYREITGNYKDAIGMYLL